MATVYKIHPSIGVARVGNSPIDAATPLSKQYENFYIAPETSGGLPIDPATNQPISSFGNQNIFRDKSGNLKKQAARFKIYSYDDSNPNDKGTLVSAGGNIKAIKWTVYLANKKASWYQFKQLTGSGQEGDLGYIKNNQQKPGTNPLRNESVTGSARQNLIIDPGPRSIQGPSQSAEFNLDSSIKGQTFPPSTIEPFPITTLGSIFTDDDSNLIVFGGNGNSGTTNLNPDPNYKYEITAYANNDGWFDDISDGPVCATLITDSGDIEVEGAWVIAAPPGYAPQVINQVSLYDTMRDVFTQSSDFPDFGNDIYDKAKQQFINTYKVNVEEDIQPILAKPSIYSFVANIPKLGQTNHILVETESQQGGDPGQFPYYILRSPENKNQPGLMPKLAGDNPISDATISKYLTLTGTQYFLLTQWFKGIVSSGGSSNPLGPGEELDKANLDNCVGGPFCPGIEMTWISRNPTIYTEPFRIRHPKTMPTMPGMLSLTNGADGDYTTNGVEPGDLSKYMAQPWQADFNECSTQPIYPSGNNETGTEPNPPILWWWPAQRPWSVFPQDQTTQQLAWTRGYLQNPNNGTTEKPNLGDMQMVTCWKYLGFVFTSGSEPFYGEVERDTQSINTFSASPPFNNKSAAKPSPSNDNLKLTPGKVKA